MKIKTAIVQIFSLIVVALLAIWIYVTTTDDRLNLAVVNGTGYPISKFALKHEDQYCAVTTLLAGEEIQCTLADGESISISVHGRIDGESLLLEDISEIKVGKSFRNVLHLKPNGNYGIDSIQVIN